jgi:hypothetical protein
MLNGPVVRETTSLNLILSIILQMLNGPVVRETSSLNLIQSMILQIKNVEWSSCKGDLYTKSHTVNDPTN